MLFARKSWSGHLLSRASSKHDFNVKPSLDDIEASTARHLQGYKTEFQIYIPRRPDEEYCEDHGSGRNP